MKLVKFQTEEWGFLKGILAYVRDEYVPDGKRLNIMEQSFSNGLALIEAAMNAAEDM